MFSTLCAALFAAIGTTDLSQQATGTQARETTAAVARDTVSVPATQPATGAPPVAAATSPDTNARLVGRLRLANGAPAGGAMVTITSVSGSPYRQYVIRSDTTGQFAHDSVRSGAYWLRIQGPSGDSAAVHLIRVRGTTRADAVLTPAPEDTRTPMQRWLTFACLLLYGLAMLFARWHHIARSVHAMLDRQIMALETRLETEVEGGNSVKLTALRTAIDALRADFKKLRDDMPKLHEFFFWSRGRENSFWVVIHEIERQMAAFLAPREQVDVYLQSAEAELRTLNKRVALGVANAIATELALARPSEKMDPDGAR